MTCLGGGLIPSCGFELSRPQPLDVSVRVRKYCCRVNLTVGIVEQVVQAKSDGRKEVLRPGRDGKQDSSAVSCVVSSSCWAAVAGFVGRPGVVVTTPPL